MSASAQLDTESGNGHHADPIAVLLAKECHGAGSDCFLRIPNVSRNWGVGDDVLGNEPFDSRSLLRCHWVEVRKVEPQPIWCHERALLLHVVTEYGAESGVQ